MFYVQPLWHGLNKICEKNFRLAFVGIIYCHLVSSDLLPLQPASETAKKLKPLREFCVVLFCHICVRFCQEMVFVPHIYIHLYDVLYWCKRIAGLYLGFLETIQNSLKRDWLHLNKGFTLKCFRSWVAWCSFSHYRLVQQRQRHISRVRISKLLAKLSKLMLLKIGIGEIFYAPYRLWTLDYNWNVLFCCIILSYIYFLFSAMHFLILPTWVTILVYSLWWLSWYACMVFSLSGQIMPTKRTKTVYVFQVKLSQDVKIIELLDISIAIYDFPELPYQLKSSVFMSGCYFFIIWSGVIGFMGYGVLWGFIFIAFIYDKFRFGFSVWEKSGLCKSQ